MSKKIFIFILIITILFLFACKPQEFSEKTFPPSEIPSENSHSEQPKPSTDQYGLDTLCSGEQGCKEFCQNNQEICEKYCRGKYENEFCKKYFLSPQEEVLPERNAQEQHNLKTCSGT